MTEAQNRQDIPECPDNVTDSKTDASSRLRVIGARLSGSFRFLFGKPPIEGSIAFDRVDPLSGIREAATDKSWFATLYAPLRPAYKQALLLAFGINVIGLFASIFALQVYDRVVAKGGNATLIALSTGMFIAIGIDYFLRQGRSALMRRIGVRVEVVIARSVYQRLTQLPAIELESRSPSFWQSTFRDIELVRTTTTAAPALLLIDLPFTLMTLILLAFIAPPLFPLAIAIMIAFVGLAWYSERSMTKNSQSEKKSLINRDAMLSELSASRMQLKSAGPSKLMSDKWEECYASWMDQTLSTSAKIDHYRDISQGMTIASTVVMTTFGAVAILSQLMTMGALIAANILTGKLVGPLVQLVSHWRTFGQFSEARARLDDLFALDLEKQHSPVALRRPAGKVTIDNVHFTYPNMNEPQINGLSGRLGPGGLHAIVGNNGSGKTTLLKLLRGLYIPSQGHIYIDDADLKQFGQIDLASWIGYLPQQPRLIAGTIRDNLILSAPMADDEDIVRACRLADAYDFIVSLPDGFDTQVGEAGGRFSSGQRKRIAIAQTLINDPPILLMDEPTSDLDTNAELTFVESMQRLATNHTIILVTHSSEVLKRCDGIVMMNGGKVMAAGVASEMLPKIGFRSSTPIVMGQDNA